MFSSIQNTEFIIPIRISWGSFSLFWPLEAKIYNENSHFFLKKLSTRFVQSNYSSARHGEHGKQLYGVRPLSGPRRRRDAHETLVISKVAEATDTVADLPQPQRRAPARWSATLCVLHALSALLFPFDSSAVAARR